MGLLLKRALDRAAVWHRAQKRKYPAVEVPYMSHCAGVAVTLARHGFDDEVVAAGALHDVIEDCGVSFDTLRDHFGDRVATLVLHATETDKALAWEERKRRYVEAFLGKPWDAQAITLADKIDNFESIVLCRAEHGDPWPLFKRGRDVQLALFAHFEEKVAALPPHPLIDEYREALARVRATP
jgi:(p)ppGpp synthase/HD superfamily hydrolase